MQQLIDEAKACIDEALKGSPKALIAFSGGKDSVVMAHIASTHAGLISAVADTSFWFDTGYNDAKISAAQLGLDCAWVDRFGDDYLHTHRNWLFNNDSQVKSVLFTKRQQTTLRKHALENKYQVVITGRRREENTVPSMAYRTKSDILNVHPLCHWKEVDIWRYIKENGLHIPKIYSHEIGQKEGNTPWVFVTPKLYKHSPSWMIRDFCPATYARLIQKRIITRATP